MPAIICEAFHDVHCFKLAKCIPQFCLDLVHVIKFLFLKAILTYGQIKTMLQIWQVQRVRNSHFISWPEIQVATKRSEQMCCHGRETNPLNPTFTFIRFSQFSEITQVKSSAF